MTTDYNAWNEMFKTSQKMMDSWMNAFMNKEDKEDDNGQDGFNFSFENYTDWLKFQQFLFKSWQDMSKMYSSQSDWFTNPSEYWTKLMSSYSPFNLSDFMNIPTRNIFEKMLNSNELYNEMYKQWEKFNTDILKPNTADYEKNVHELIDQFNKLFTERFIPLLPEDLQGLMTNTQSYFNNYIQALENFIGPWAHAYQNIADIYMATALKDPMELPNALTQWKNAYDETFGVLIKSPVVGNARELLEQNNRTLDSMIDMLVTLSEFLTSSLSVTYKHSEEAIKNYFESIENGEDPKTFKEFYDMWSNYVEKAIEKYFYTDEFSKLIAKTVDSSMVFKIEYDKLVEKALQDFPIVTKSEVDNVYKNVHDLRREVRALKKEVEKLQEKPSTQDKQ